MRTSIAAFATDFHDEGTGTALGRIQDRGGIGGVTLAAVYHHGRDIFPHSPVRKVRFLEGGRAFFRPDASRYRPGGLAPVASSLAGQWDALAALRTATAARGMDLHAWTVFTHNTLLGSTHPEAAVVNVYGDPQLTYLCPANPLVVEYCRALAADIARYEVDSVLAESLHYHPLEHGYHHERYLIDIGPADRLLLGLCFCQYCRVLAASRGVDAGQLAASVRARLDAVFASAGSYDPAEPGRQQAGQLWDGALAAFLDAREAAVAALAAAVSDGLSGTGVRLAFMDAAGAMKGYADGRPGGGPAPEVSWQIGVSPALIAPHCEEFLAAGYAADPQRVSADLRAYLSLLAGQADLRVALRPLPPDCHDAANLAAKLEVARQAGATTLDFYHYGFARLETLDLVRGALGTSRGGGSEIQ
jgi:hypothetical protein